jgi:4-amino-4-deoxy-L-arabinose transferase-like glycosyltransferase
MGVSAFPRHPTPDTRATPPNTMATDTRSSNTSQLASIVTIFTPVWRARGLWLGLIALALALHGQQLIVSQREQAVSVATGWYIGAVVLMTLAWLGTYKNKSLLRLPGLPTHPQLVSQGRVPGVSQGVINDQHISDIRPSTGHRSPNALWHSATGHFFVITWIRLRWRYALAFGALALNIYSAMQLRADYYSALGGLGWLASLVLLLVAFIGHRPNPGIDADAGVLDVQDRTDIRISRMLETLLVVGILGLALGFRLYRLGDVTAGMNGDEGEAGVEALKILQGQWVSPFLPGWFGQSNVYYWAIALTMRVFGTGLFGLRMFSTLVGSLMIVPFYLLVRMWFGVRAALIASVLLAISDVAAQVSKLEFSNGTTPFFLVLGFYFLSRGLRSRRTLDFVLCGYSYLASFYFYNGGRLAPFLLLLVLIYLFVLMPSAVSGHRSLVTRYRGQLLALVIASICMASPWLVYFFDHTEEVNGRTRDTLIFNKPDRMASDYHATHTPLYLGLRLPGSGDQPTVSPLVFEQTPVSLKLSDDGFWPRVLWGQTAATLSILTYRSDTSTQYAVNAEPITKPIEAVLIILGICWALWRWRDTRMAMLSLWFWSTIFVGGVLTEGAPYMPRLVGIIPTLAIFAAVILNKLAAELVDLVSGLRYDWRNAAQAFSATVIMGLLVYLSVQNYVDYYSRHVVQLPYVWSYRFPIGQALFVQQANEASLAEGRPRPIYYVLGSGVLDWNQGDNRFINYGTPGANVLAPSSVLPLIDNADRDAVFVIAESDRAYLPVIKAYYPGGKEGSFDFGPSDSSAHLFTYYYVTREQIEAQRTSAATYTPAEGTASSGSSLREFRPNTFQREEAGLGTTSPAPANLVYPVRATWRTQLVAPAFARYHFLLAGPPESTLTIDGLPLAVAVSADVPAEAEVILAHGLHNVELSATLTSSSDTVQLWWSAGGSAEAPVARSYLWNGPGRGLLGEVHSLQQNATAAPADAPVVGHQVDGFLSFHYAHDALGQDGPLFSIWAGNLTVTQPGSYGFEVSSRNRATLSIDGKIVVDKLVGEPDAAKGAVDLGSGSHEIQLQYWWTKGDGALSVSWTPPGGQPALISPDVLNASGGAWQPGTIPEPPAYQLPANTRSQP